MPIKMRPVQGPSRGLIALKDIGRGKNIKASKYTLTAGEMILLQNWYLDEDGSLLARRGTSTLNPTSLGATPVDGAGRGYMLNGNFWLGMSGGTVSQSPDGITFTTSTTGFTSGSPAWFMQYLTYVYLATRVDTPKKWNGTAWTNMGIAAPISAPTAAIGAAGNLTGTYTAEVTFGTPTVESNPGPPSSPITLTAQQLSLTNIPISPDPNCNQRRVYLFKDAVSSVYQLVAIINDNTTTTLTVNIDQQNWTTVVTSTNNPPPVGPWVTTLFKNRLWKIGDPNHPQRLYFSQIFVPEAWPIAFFIDIPFDKNGVGTTLFVLGDLLLICSDNQVAYCFGDTPFSFTIKMSFAQSGCPSPWAIDQYANTAVRLSAFGVLAFDGSQDQSLSDPIEPAFNGVLPQISEMLYSSAKNAALKYYDRLKAFAVTWPSSSGGGTNDTTYWYFLRRPGWVQDNRSARLFLADDGVGGSRNLYAWSATAGQFQQWDTNYTDDGVPITGILQTGQMGGDTPTTKQFNWITLRAQPGSYTANITGYVDDGVEADAFSLNLALGAVYGTAIYGTSLYSASGTDFDERFAPNMVGRSISVRMDLTYSAFVRLFQIFCLYADKGTVRHHVGVS